MSKLTNANLIFMVDSYKITHPTQFPTGTEYTQYYIESRGGLFDYVMANGSIELAQTLEAGITVADVEEANMLFNLHFGRDLFNYTGWMIIATELQGKLPLRIRALKEGTPVKIKTAMVLIENTDPRFGWLPGHFETKALRSIWYPSTVGTISMEAKKIIAKFLKMTTDDEVIPGVLPFRLHDFGARGVSSGESAAIGGLAHLYNFMGTDGIEALVYASKLFRNADCIGYSIPAREHSTTTIYFEEHEDDAFLNSIEQFL